MREEELIDDEYDQPFEASKLSDFFKSKGKYRAHKSLIRQIHPLLVEEHRQPTEQQTPAASSRIATHTPTTHIL